jgi:hypothetical protein
MGMRVLSVQRWDEMLGTETAELSYLVNGEESRNKLIICTSLIAVKKCKIAKQVSYLYGMRH